MTRVVGAATVGSTFLGQSRLTAPLTPLRRVISLMKCSALFLVAALVASVSGFSSPSSGGTRLNEIGATVSELSRVEFLRNVALVTVGATTSSLVFPMEPAMARGRATLEFTYERYVPRIIAGGEFYKKDFQALVAKADWKGIQNALAEPPKKTKEDRTKEDGGIAERAAQAGKFSDARVLVACELFAGSFSDNSISPKTKKMKAEVDELREVVNEMLLVAREGSGEDVDGGGVLGFGAKKSSQDELRKRVRDLYVRGGTAYNKFIFAANEDLAVRFAKLPYL